MKSFTLEPKMHSDGQNSPKLARISNFLGEKLIEEVSDRNQNLVGDRLKCFRYFPSKIRKTRQICKKILSFESVLPRK